MIDIQLAADRVRFSLKARPGAKRNSVDGEHEGLLKVSVTAPPEDGKANRAIVELLSKVLDMPRRTIQIVRGATSSTKIVEIAEIDADQLQRLFAGLIAAPEKGQA